MAAGPAPDLEEVVEVSKVALTFVSVSCADSECNVQVDEEVPDEDEGKDEDDDDDDVSKDKLVKVRR